MPSSSPSSSLSRTHSWPATAVHVRRHCGEFHRDTATQTSPGRGRDDEPTVEPCSGAIAAAALSTAAATQSASESVAKKKQQYIRSSRLLQRHYYPEGGWGWVIVFCATCIHILNHGLQLAFSVENRFILATFKAPALCTGSCARLNRID
ncbi:hypothetical protein U1Q18_050890 [Sarracenia purpurea var. burkii]